MIIKKIELQGFSSYKDFTEVPIPTGIIGITGEYDYGVVNRSNGTGKTSLIMSIIYTLYGKGEFAQSFKEIINDTLTKKDEMFSKVIFVLNGNTYTCVRGVKNNESYLDFFENDNKLGSGINNTQEYINNIIGMDYDMFTASIFFEQSKANKFINTQPDKRRTYIDKLFGLEIWRVCYKNIVKDTKALLSAIENCVLSINNLEIDKQNYLTQIKPKKDLQNLLSTLQTNKQQKEEHLRTISQSKYFFDTIIVLQEDLKNLNAKSISLKNEIDSLEKTKITYKDEYETLIASNTSSSEVVDVTNLKSELEQLRVDEKKLQHEIVQYQLQQTSLQSDLKYLEAEKENIKEGVCYTCKQVISTEYCKNTHEEYNTKISTIKDKITQLTNLINDGNSKIETYIKDIGEKTLEITQTEKNNTDILNQKHATEIRIESIKSKLENIEHQLYSYRENLDTINTTYSEKHLEYKKLEDQVKGIVNPKEEIESIKKELKSLDTDIQNTNQKLASIQIIESNINSIDDKLNIINNDLKNKEYELSLLEELSTSFKKIPEQIFTQSLTAIKQYVDSLLVDIYPNITVNIYEDTSKNKKLIIGFLVNGRPRSYERMSGGQKVICDICLRIGFSKIIMQRARTRLKFVALDEPFTALDKVNRDLIQNVFSSMLNEFEQILIITHTEDVENYSRNIHVKMNSDGVSYIN